MLNVMDGRTKYGTYTVTSGSGVIIVDIDGPPKHCKLTVVEFGKRRVERFVRDHDMPAVWALVK